MHSFILSGATTQKLSYRDIELPTCFAGYKNTTFLPVEIFGLMQWRTEGGLGGVQTPLLEIPKTLQHRAKLNPIVKTVKNC